MELTRAKICKTIKEQLDVDVELVESTVTDMFYFVGDCFGKQSISRTVQAIKTKRPFT